MFSLIRLTRLIFRSRVAMIAVGVIVAIIGLVYGLTSTQVNYETQQVGVHYNVILSTLGNLYLHADGSPDWFILQKDDVSPPLDTSSLPDHATIDFVARTDTIDVNADLGQFGSTTSAHVVEHLTFHDANGATIASYSTQEYLDNPNGVYVNNWPVGIVILVIGLVLFGLSFAIHRPKQLPGFAVAGQPPVYGQPNANPYGQPMANPYAQGQPNANPYGQPAPNPYGQPYQGPPPAGQPYNPYPPNPSNPQYPQQ